MRKMKEIDDGVLACLRVLYEDSDVPMTKLAKLAGVSPSTFWRRVLAEGWTVRGKPSVRRGEPAVSDMPGLAGRIRRNIEQQIAEAERHLAKPGSSAARLNDSERAARTLASLSKTLNELTRLEHHVETHGPKDGNDAIDLDEFRRDLARRLEELCSEGED